MEFKEEQTKRYLLIWESEYLDIDRYLCSETKFDDYIYGFDEALEKYKRLKVHEAEEGPSVSDIQLFEIRDVSISDKTRIEITQAIETHKKEVQSKKEKENKARIASQEAVERKQYAELKKKYGN